LVGVIAEGAAKRIILILVGAETFAGSRPSSDKYSQRVMSEVKVRKLFINEEWEPHN
jgi:hypothetical protein